jgi:hypothetical protein|tara:strand:+ start:3997 stop:4467 length:471 start_codon:yes stop_codon:yes gene_type:complete
MIDYLYNYIVNPIFFWYDIYYEYFFEKKKIEKIPEFNNFYDIDNDLIIINYVNKKEGLEYILKINRMNEINLKKKIEKLKNMENEKDLFINVAYNGNINLTNRALSIIGPNGEHNLLYKLRVRDLLNFKETINFDSLEIMDQNCDIRFLQLNDYIL